MMGWGGPAVLLVGVATSAGACELCAVTSAVEARGDGIPPPFAVLGPVAASAIATAETTSPPAAPILEPRPEPGRPLGLGVGVLSAFEPRRTTVRGDDEVAGDDHIDTARADLMLSWRFGGRYGVRAYVPYLVRDYELGGDEDTLRGLGDTLVEVFAMPVRRVAEGRLALVTVFVGAFLPTGDDDLLTAHETSPASSGGHSHGGGGVATAPLSHGHHLALGSGSVDPVAGASAYVRRDRWFVTGHVLYRFALENGDGYHRGGECMWGGGPGYLVVDTAGGTVGVQVNVSGMWHDPDEHRGTRVAHSGSAEVFVGPAATCTWRDLISAELGLDLPVWHEASGTQLVADWRLHAGISASF